MLLISFTMKHGSQFYHLNKNVNGIRNSHIIKLCVWNVHALGFQFLHLTLLFLFFYTYISIRIP